MRILLRSSAFLLTAGLILFLFLPQLFDSFVAPRILDRLQFSDKEVTLSRITPWSVRGALHLGEMSGGVNVPRFEVAYSLRGLVQGKASTLTVYSASVDLSLKEGRLSIAWLPGDKSKSDGKRRGGGVFLPVAVERLVLNKCSLNIRGENGEIIKHLLLDGDLRLTYGKNVGNIHKIEEIEGAFGTQGVLQGKAYLHSKYQGGGYVSSFTLDTGNISHLLAGLPTGGAELSTGPGRIVGSFTTTGFSEVESYRVEADFSKFILRRGEVEATGISTDKSIGLSVEGDRKKARIHLRGLTVQQAGQTEMFRVEMSGEYFFAEKSLAGTLKVLPEITNKTVLVNYAVIIKGDMITTQYQLTGDPFRIDDIVEVGIYSADGFLQFKDGRFEGGLTADLAKISLPEKEVALHDLSLHFPLTFPIADDQVDAPGNIIIGRVSYKGVNSAIITAAATRKKNLILVEANMATPFVDDFSFSCSGSADIKGAGLFNCSLPEIEIDSSSLPPFVILPEPLSFTGKIAAELKANFSKRGVAGVAKVNYREGTVGWGQYELKDISLDVEFPDFPALRSKPGQLLTIGSLDFGKIKMTDAAVRFRIDDNQNIFIERAKLNWCGGRVETGALSLYKGMDSIETTLYCDRLGYTELLGQLGIGDAEGEGALNGRLPLHITKTGIQFDDGFLFSTPGNSGIVRFTNTKQLRQNMPGAGEAAYLDYSLSALENFSYNWTKLRFNTENEELLLSLQLDGKPAEPLPYGYKNGQIVKTAKGTGLQHPIRLDVNFRLPVKDLFQYGKNIQSIMENM